ncbi:rod shape-determining protein RodA [bacterium]|nr:rod shape-determining protein RodA [bacterium]
MSPEGLGLNSDVIEGPSRRHLRTRVLFETLRYLDPWLVLAVAALTGFGLWILFGAVQGTPHLLAAADRQVTWFFISLAAMAAALLVDYQWLKRLAPYAYIANLLLLIVVLFAGRTVNGATSWLRFGPLSFQPSETMKIATVMMLAQWYAHRPGGVQRLRDLAGPALLCGAPALLVLRQPDLGTASLFGILFLAMLFWAGCRRWIFGGLIGGGALVCISLYPFLKTYQKERLLTFIDPFRDPQGAGYNVIQSMIAVGSGGLSGRGWGEGTQAVFHYLPEAHTDFIFASAIEQTGLIGAIVIFGLYGVVFWRMLATVQVARDRFGALLVVGLGAIVMGHVFMNVGMTIGLFPVTGLPLPFLSYGGSFLFAMHVLVGLVLNVSMRRFVFARRGG